MIAARALALGWLLAAGLGSASAGPWTARSPAGWTWTLVEDSTRARDGYFLERRYADGSLDASFGAAGSVRFSLGPDNEGPAALRVDDLQRAWVAGASHEGERTLAVLLRFSPLGAPDPGWGSAGRLAMAPAGREARALDVLPQADGSAWVLGQVTTATGTEVSGLWRVRADGSIDTAWGIGGLWLASAETASAPDRLVAGSDGSIAWVSQRNVGEQTVVESWHLPAGATMPTRLGEAILPPGASAPRVPSRAGPPLLGDPRAPVESGTAGAAGSNAQLTSATPASRPASSGPAQQDAARWLITIGAGAFVAALAWWWLKARKRRTG